MEKSKTELEKTKQDKVEFITPEAVSRTIKEWSQKTGSIIPADVASHILLLEGKNKILENRTQMLSLFLDKKEKKLQQTDIELQGCHNRLLAEVREKARYRRQYHKTRGFIDHLVTFVSGNLVELAFEESTDANTQGQNQTDKTASCLRSS